MFKAAMAQALLRKLYEKQAGIVAPAVIGAAALGATHVARQGSEKAKEYKAGFQPGFVPNHGGH